MSDDAAIITATLDQVVQRVGDPVPMVFAHLFRETPAIEALFVRDPDGLVRGQMFQVTMESLLDYLGDQSYGANLIQIERVNHVGLGVDPEVFDRFYFTVMGGVSGDPGGRLDGRDGRGVDACGGELTGQAGPGTVE